MKAVLRAISASCLAAFIATSLHGDEVTWQGANTKPLDDYARVNWYDQDDGTWVWKPGLDASVVEPFAVTSSSSVNGHSLWSNGTVPGSGDTANFNWHTDRRNFAQVGGVYPVEADVIIDGDFSPARIYHNSHLYQAPVKNILLAKDLTIESLYWKSGYTTAKRGRARD